MRTKRHFAENMKQVIRSKSQQNLLKGCKFGEVKRVKKELSHDRQHDDTQNNIRIKKDDLQRQELLQIADDKKTMRATLTTTAVFTTTREVLGPPRDHEFFYTI